MSSRRVCVTALATVAIGLIVVGGQRLTRPAEAETANVEIVNNGFSPQTVRVLMTEGEPGFPGMHAHVNWYMLDAGTEHTVTFDDQRLPSSDRMSKGGGHGVVFSEAGTFTYFCSIHPGMRGTVVVMAPAPNTAANPSPAAHPAPVPGRPGGVAGIAGPSSPAVAVPVTPRAPASANGPAATATGGGPPSANGARAASGPDPAGGGTAASPGAGPGTGTPGSPDSSVMPYQASNQTRDSASSATPWPLLALLAALLVSGFVLVRHLGPVHRRARMKHADP